MALSSAEKQKRYRERLREKQKLSPDPTDAYAHTPFSEWMKGDWSFLEYALDWAGMKNIPDFEADGDVDPDWAEQHAEGYEKGPNRGSIGRAERMASQFFDAAMFLAEKINTYKKEQISRRIAEIEATGLEDPATRSEALSELIKLNRVLARLQKQARHDFPLYEIKGE